MEKTKDGTLSGNAFIRARIQHDKRLLSYFTGDCDPAHEDSNRAIIARLEQRIDRLKSWIAMERDAVNSTDVSVD